MVLIHDKLILYDSLTPNHENVLEKNVLLLLFFGSESNLFMVRVILVF